MKGLQRIAVVQPEGAEPFPQVSYIVPDSWPSIILAPLYDVHIGHKAHDAVLFKKHLRWIADTKNVLSWVGGDLIENAGKTSPGASVFDQTEPPDDQLATAKGLLRPIAKKLLFGIPGNHEQRTDQAGFHILKWLSEALEVPYFSDFCFLTLKWRGLNYRILAHHGTGAAQTPGGQRNAARKMVPWAKPFDVFWTGHLHNALVDILYQTDVDQQTGVMFERTAVVMISPSYLRYFGTYAAQKEYPPGSRGLGVIELRADGNIDVSLHARGRRL